MPAARKRKPVAVKPSPDSADSDANEADTPVKKQRKITQKIRAPAAPAFVKKESDTEDPKVEDNDDEVESDGVAAGDEVAQGE